MKIEDVHSVAIYPSIGIARIGNSPTEYFLGPTILVGYYFSRP